MERSLREPALHRLEERLRAAGSALVAFSGGVDSSLVAAVAQRALGSAALAVTGAAETLAGAELERARRVAAEIGIAHHVITYSELADPEFARNPAWRCYVCQGMRFDRMVALAEELGYALVCDGTTADDPGPDRPGLRAVRERRVCSPLLEAGLGKAEVRRLARLLGLSVWDEPANACLSSRIPHGQQVTAAKLRRVEAAERLLATRGFRVVRVRHDGGEARVEVGVDETARLACQWEELEPRLRELGFSAARFDAQGYRQGGADRPRRASG